MEGDQYDYKRNASTVTGLEPAILRSEVWCLIHSAPQFLVTRVLQVLIYLYELQLLFYLYTCGAKICQSNKDYLVIQPKGPAC